jgi:hypothetical protein
MSAYRTSMSLQHLSKNCQEGCQGLEEQIPYKTLDSIRGISTRTLCQKTHVTIKTKQKSVDIGDRTTHISSKWN